MDTNKIPFVTVIVTTKNEELNIAACLESIKKHAEGAQIIVVDNFSADKTAQIVQKFTPKVYLKGPERSAQRNFGLKKARGKYVLFLDADMELTKNLIRECTFVAKKNSKTAGIIIDEQSKGNNFLARIKSIEKRLTNKETAIEAARFFKRADLEKIGGYDENLISGEDWDLSIRMSKLGSFARVKSKIIHKEDKTFWQDVKKKYYYAKYIQKYAIKHPDIYKKQSGFKRLAILFKKPELIFEDPLGFSGLILLKTVQYIAYLNAKANFTS